MFLQKAHQTAAAIGVGLIAMGEDLGATMATRSLEHLLSYGDPEVRAGVPPALALLHASTPDMYTMDTLSRLSHDSDNAVARGALLALGVIGAGTNNARLAGADSLGVGCYLFPSCSRACPVKYPVKCEALDR
jgi:26S proteasome regulatory subunit N1